MREIELIQSTGLLKAEDFSFLADHAPEMRETLAKRQIFRTETEMEISVLNDIKHPTRASKYWQSVREQAGMIESLVDLSFEYRRNEVAIKRLQKRADGSLDALDLEDLQIDLDECLFKRANMETVAIDRMREIRLWSQIKAELDDGSFDSGDVNTHQLVSYAQRFVLQAFNAPAEMPVAEANNLKGQLVTALRQLSARGLLEQVVAGLPPAVVQRVLVGPGLIQIAHEGEAA